MSARQGQAQLLVQLGGHKRQKRVQQTEQVVKLGPAFAQDCGVARAQSFLVVFNPLAAERVAKRALQQAGGVGELVLLQQPIELFAQVVQMRGAGLGDGRTKLLKEAAGVPDFVEPGGVLLERFGVEFHVQRGLGAGGQMPTQCVSAKLIDDLQGVNSVAQGLGHFFVVLVADQSVKKNMGEGPTAGEKFAHHPHARAPEEQNVFPRFHPDPGVKLFKVGGLVGPAQGGKRPQRGEKPGVQGVGGGGSGGVSIIKQPNSLVEFERQGQPPGDLAGQTPGLEVGQKRAQFVGGLLGGDGQLPAVQGRKQGSRQMLRVHVPLIVFLVNPAFVPTFFEGVDG